MYFPSDIEEDLCCSFCRKKFTDVIKILNCGESICRSCHDELQGKKLDATRHFKCQVCSKSHLMPEDGLPENRSLSRLIKRRKIENPSSDHVALTLGRQLAALRDQADSLKSFNKIDYINRYCNEAENMVKEACEAVVKRFDQIQHDHLVEINEYRSKRLESVASTSQQPDAYNDRMDTLNQQMDTLNAKWRDRINRVEVLASVDEISEAAYQAKAVQAKMIELEAELKDDALAGQIISFRPRKSIFQLKDGWIRSFDLSLDFILKKRKDQTPSRVQDESSFCKIFY